MENCYTIPRTKSFNKKIYIYVKQNISVADSREKPFQQYQEQILNPIWLTSTSFHRLACIKHSTFTTLLFFALHSLPPSTFSFFFHLLVYQQNRPRPKNRYRALLCALSSKFLFLLLFHLSIPQRGLWNGREGEREGGVGIM